MTPVPKGCGKIAYDTRRDAEKAVRSLLTRKGQAKRDQGANVYFCRACGAHHFGHKPRGRSLFGVR